jgi:predicted O-linked N-acetylglucosamine transferase (SPINDLY family)
MAGSLLHAVGLPELATNSLDEYEEKALALASDFSALRDLRERLAQNRLSSPLFNTERITRHLEAAYLQMHERAVSGEAPAAFAVSPIQMLCTRPV